MTNQEIKSLIENHPEAVIAAAIEYNPEIAPVVEDARKAGGSVSSMAAVVMRSALTMYGRTPAGAQALLALVKIPA